MRQGVAPGEKSQNFGPTIRRILSMLKPARGKIALIILLTAMAVIMQVAGPALLGQATDIIYVGVLGGVLADMPSGLSPKKPLPALKQTGVTSLPTWWAEPTSFPAKESTSATSAGFSSLSPSFT
ncbi:hypothetical protein [Flaviflexus ciconiae]|uniref:hypothetical protein n=1 Tax=Flaviflexus ciconiae TaxID=2496867 RepID=UPI001D180D0D|nr:hypothetical protein [Flaviflexus ciconiae]